MIYISFEERCLEMAHTGIAKLFRNGRSQAVRLPREFRFDGNQVRVRRVVGGILLEPLVFDAPTWFAELDHLNPQMFMRKGRNQPVTPRREIFQ
jgi:antitoxin VapB